MPLVPSKPLTRKYTDLSTTRRFQFAFHCDCCGEPVKSERYNFDLSGFKPKPKGRGRELLWRRQHDEAYERANNDAGLGFNFCPECKRWVCDRCFTAAEDDSGDICRDCRKQHEGQAWRAVLVAGSGYERGQIHAGVCDA